MILFSVCNPHLFSTISFLFFLTIKIVEERKVE